MNKRLVILGAGESGVGTAILAQKHGYDVFVSDFGAIKDMYKTELDARNIAYEEKQHTRELILNATEVVKSPGIPEKVAIVQEVLKHNIPVISEIEFAGRYSSAKHICITGSNGKTTTTSLIYYMLKNAGLNVGLAGNIGKSFARQVAEETFDYYVLELSSFQLDGMYDFRSDMALLLNITPDHLDRYEYKLENYARSKFRITQNMTSEDIFIYCADDEVTNTHLKYFDIQAERLTFSLNEDDSHSAFLKDENLVINYRNNNFMIPTDDLSLKGKHNVYNSMAAGIVANVLQLRKEVIRDSLMSFSGVEHRLEHVLKVHGIEFINDSKATNVNSTWYALESMPEGTVWIAGGVDKGNDYSDLLDLVKAKVKAIVCLGTDNSKLLEAFNGVVETIVETDSMHEAVRSAYYLAKMGETVVLSPACASFDLFENYEDRGRQFKAAVRNL